MSSNIQKFEKKLKIHMKTDMKYHGNSWDG